MYLAFFPMTEAEAFNNQCVTDKDALRFLKTVDDVMYYDMNDVGQINQFVVDNNSGDLKNMVSVAFHFDRDGFDKLLDEISAEDEARQAEEQAHQKEYPTVENLFNTLMGIFNEAGFRVNTQDKHQCGCNHCHNCQSMLDD